MITTIFESLDSAHADEHGRGDAAFQHEPYVREYVEKLYLPAHEKYFDRISGKANKAAAISTWQESLKTHWPQVRFGK